GAGIITAPYHSVSTERTLSIWSYRSGTGGGGFGRLFDRALTSGNELFYINGPSYEYQITWSGGTGAWYVPLPAASTCVNHIIVYNGASTANDPIIYVNGVSASVTEV